MHGPMYIKKLKIKLSKCIVFSSNVLLLFPNDFITTVVTTCFQVQHASDTSVVQNITLLVVCFFSILKTWYLDFPCMFTLFQLTLSAGQVGTLAEIWDKKFPSFSLRISSNLCRSDCSSGVPRGGVEVVKPPPPPKF